ncbi:MAG: tripartite tricarboxylate transporter substrate-binding protein [Desulfobacterales bacterium]|nr:tripartite tricarboxylate transporter substrate-binding protein [Desulfobacterales bacterium]
MKKKTISKMARVSRMFLVLGLVCGVAPVLAAESPEEFYRGKTIALYTGSIGGSADSLCRALAPFLQKETGAKVIVANHPGGNSMQTVNLAYKKKPDGLILLVHETSGIILSDWFEDPGAVWKAANFNWIARVAFQPGIAVVSPQSPYRSIDDLRKAKGLKLGASTPMGYYGPVNSLFASILNLDAQVITGLKGTSGIVLSIQKGEIDGGALSEDRAAVSAKGNQVRPLFVVSGESALFPDLPVLDKVVKLTQDQELVLDAVATVNKAIVTTPGVPMDRVDFLRKTIHKITQNKSIQKVLMEKTGIAGWYGYVPGETVQKNMADPSIGPRVRKTLEAILSRYLVR